VGTVEFLLDQNGDFFFLEMNTRLQVEHPVTEEDYGIDLVCEQISLALGERLSLRQDELIPRGHAIECRVYAEDPLRNFAPSPGRIVLLVRPNGPGVRVDSGILPGSVVPLEYDPMLSKLVVWASDRMAAVDRLRRALNEYQIRGISTTLTLFRALVEMDVFRQAQYHTGFLDELLASRRLEELHGEQDPEAEQTAVVAAACLATLKARSLPDDVFAHGDDSSWWAEGMRMGHGRFPR
jgi:acetyl-CoA carboxylase biotin carboxylase subunit